VSPARARIKRFVEDELLGGGRLADGDSLWEAGVDSLGIIKLVRFVEKAFSLSVPPRDVRPRTFASIESIAEYVERRGAEKKR